MRWAALLRCRKVCADAGRTSLNKYGVEAAYLKSLPSITSSMPILLRALLSACGCALQSATGASGAVLPDSCPVPCELRRRAACSADAGLCGCVRAVRAKSTLPSSLMCLRFSCRDLLPCCAASACTALGQELQVSKAVRASRYRLQQYITLQYSVSTLRCAP